MWQKTIASLKSSNFELRSYFLAILVWLESYCEGWVSLKNMTVARSLSFSKMIWFLVTFWPGHTRPEMYPKIIGCSNRCISDLRGTFEAYLAHGTQIYLLFIASIKFSFGGMFSCCRWRGYMQLCRFHTITQNRPTWESLKILRWRWMCCNSIIDVWFNILELKSLKKYRRVLANRSVARFCHFELKNDKTLWIFSLSSCRYEQIFCWYYIRILHGKLTLEWCLGLENGLCIFKYLFTNKKSQSCEDDFVPKNPIFQNL